MLRASACPGLFSVPSWVIPADGLIAEWRFAEGSGNTVADAVGTAHINLALPTDPNVTWTSKGVLLASGLVQTPSIAGARTIAQLYRVGRGEVDKFLQSAGAGSGNGALTSNVGPTQGEVWIGSGSGVRNVRRRLDTGADAFALNRGGWVLLFREMPAAYTTIVGLGGRHSTTTSRCADFEIAWAGVWNRVLTADERTQTYNAVRQRIATPRGIYLDARDCPAQADCVLLWGQSNADGRAVISGLSSGDQARDFTRVYIEPATSSVRGTPPPALLDLGVNQTITSPGTQFGPEMGIGWRREDAAPGRDLYICKTAQGGTYLAPSSVGGSVTVSNTWHPGEVVTSSLMHRALAADWYDTEQALLSQGIGPNLRALCWMQGEQDAVQQTAADAYQAALQALYDDVRLYTSYPSLPIVVARIRGLDPSGTYAATVRAAQAAFVAANSAAVLVDTDGMVMACDNVHYNAAGMKALGQAFYDAVF